MGRWVEITFDCLPLRSVTRLDIPIDASPKYRAQCERIKAAIEKHGSHNTYYLYGAQCRYHLTNHDDLGMLDFAFEGTAITDATDMQTLRCDLRMELIRETCDWLTAPIVAWFESSVPHSVAIEFNRYIAAGDLQKTKDRIAKLQAQTEAAGGYVGMYL